MFYGGRGKGTFLVHARLPAPEELCPRLKVSLDQREGRRRKEGKSFAATQVSLTQGRAPSLG